MVLFGRIFFMLSVVILMAAACTKPVLIGSDFLDDEKAGLSYEDDFDLSFFTKKTDSVLVHAGNNVSLQLITYLLGQVDDPVFGKYSAEIFTQPVIAQQATALQGAILDSIVLSLKYDTLGTYGELAPVTIEVYRMTENPKFNTKYYSNERFATEMDVLGSVTFTPAPKDSTLVDTVKTTPHIRIPLSRIKLGDIVLQDSSVYTNQDSFLHYLNGLNIRMTGATNTMIGIDLLHEVSGVTFYYHTDLLPATRRFQTVFSAGSVKTLHIQHDYSQRPAIQAALAGEPEIDFWYAQGLSGLTTSMEIKDLDKIGNAIINLAELEVYGTFPDGDIKSFYPPIEYLVTQVSNDSTIYQNSVDVAVALARTSGDQTSSGYQTIFGGKVTKVTDGPPYVYKYTMKVTSQVKDIFLGNKENIIYFNPFDKANVPNRSVFFGPGHPEYAPKLKVYYTVL